MQVQCLNDGGIVGLTCGSQTVYIVEKCLNYGSHQIANFAKPRQDVPKFKLSQDKRQFVRSKI